MRCPVCADTDLVMSERQGVEIDYCPKCRGVWLDRGELDKILERAERDVRGSGPSARPNEAHDSDRHRAHGSGRYKHQRKSFWGELFD